MSEVVLDASALLALLRDEPGADKVADAIADARMSSVNFAEVVSHVIHAGMPAGEVDTATGELPMREYTVLPTHYKCPHSGASMPVENPDVWVYHDELNDPEAS